jgi:outer membrane protein assembly factor BamB
MLWCTALGLLAIDGVQAADWPMWRYDAGRTAASPHELPTVLHQQWTLQLPALQPAWENALNQDLMQFDRAYEPVVAGNSLFIGSSISARMTALDTQTGRERWRFYTDGPVRLPAVVEDGRVFFVSDDGYLYCVDAEKGSLLWKFRSGPTDARILGNSRLVSMWPARGGPVVADGVIYFAASIWPFMGTFIHALDAGTGEVVWTNDGTGSLYMLQPHNSPAYGGVAPQGAMVVSGDQLLVPGGRSVPACFDRHTGEFLYYRHANYNKTGGAFVAAAAGRFVNYHRDMITSLYDVATGDRLIHQVAGVPVLTSEVMYGQGDTIRALNLGGLRQVEYSRQVRDRDTGDLITVKDHKWAMEELWRLGVDASGDLIKAGNRLYAGGRGTVTAVDVAGEPTVVWQLPIDGQVARLVAGDDKLLAVTLDGKLYAFGGDRLSVLTQMWRELEGVWTATFTEAPPEPVEGEGLDQAAAMLAAAGTEGGYALLYGSGMGALIRALVAQSDLYIVAVVPDATEVETLRRDLDALELYGARVTVQPGTPGSFRPPPYMASLIAFTSPGDVDRAAVEATFKALRPYGGAAYLPAGSGATPTALANRVRAYDLPQAAVRETGEAVVVTREGALTGSADWTHQYGDIANTVKSDDELVKLPLGVLWFGGSSNEDVLPRHGHGPPEQVVDGRLFIEGIDCISARDVYTGRVLWKRTLPELGNFGVYYDETYADTPLSLTYNQVHIPGANSRGANYVAASDGIYVALDDYCLVLDPRTGDTLSRIDLPPLTAAGAAPKWGYIGVYEDFLIAGAGEVQYTDFLDDVPEGKKARFYDLDLTASKHLIVMDRHSGEVLWTRSSTLGFRHNAIVVGNGQVYCIDRLPDPVEGALKRRGHKVADRPALLALDVRTGAVTWQREDGVFGTWLSYSSEHDVLLQAGRKSRDMVVGEVDEGMAAFRGDTGQRLWSNTAKYGGPCILHGESIITDRYAYHLLSGEQILRRDPLTGAEEPWAYTRQYGCAYAVASENLLTFRSAAGGYYDLANDGGTGNFGGFKAGCTSNLIAANGVLNAPDYTRTCSCSYPNQTSLALVHMPGVEQWVTYFGSSGEGPLQRVGINLGAPGNRRAPDGRFWIAYPLLPYIDNPEKESGLAVAVAVEASEDGFYTRHVSSTSGALNWVAASGCRGIERLEVPLNQQGAALCQVDLVFAEPDYERAGRRLIDIRIEGEIVLRGLDIFAEAQGRNRALVKSFGDIAVTDGAVTVELAPGTPVVEAMGTHAAVAETAQPVLSGLAVSVQDLATASH